MGPETPSSKISVLKATFLFWPRCAYRPKNRATLGVQNVNVILESQAVVLETALSVSEVQELLQSTGRRAVLKGMGSLKSQNLGAAVAMLEGVGAVQGVVRFLQVSENTCIIDGTVDGLSPGLHGIHIHEFGDLSMGCER
ncbi:hypothetical protein GDO78_003647 [Eleutherodactylus coqui]|uniref:Superoxide dismutase copper/zinc binding domain-containing protein n=1 Tax=Eleutherodactylus coqui TaxID=57060 RepID=A0A8J6JZC4_ELECQ|nr:hypothetical protein GDO78_003647 [Eleutherodactylus coqui]